MKKFFVLTLSLFLGTAAFAQDPVIMTIDGHPITKSEFLQIYLKNNDNPTYDKASLDDYMELFRKFKLKVAEAEDLGYDTVPKLVRELTGYRKQLARPYLIDSARNEALVLEAYDRMKEEVHASHILVRLDENATPADTLAAYNRLMGLRERIVGGQKFALVASGKNGSEDPSVKNNGGDLGFFTAFQMVYPFEETAYNTPVGEVSMPFRTRFGYHILQVHERRPARGTIEAAHIFISIGKKTGEEAVKTAEDRINEIHEMLKEGADFEELVAKHSDDPSSNQKGGKLPLFGTNTTTRMVPEFSRAAFALENDGDISEPIRTQYGFHIIKRLSWKGLAPYAELKKELQNRVSRDERSVSTQISFVAKLKEDYNFKAKGKGTRKWFYKNIDSTYYVGNFKASALSKNKPMFILDGKKFGQKAFAEYLEESFRVKKESTIESLVNNQFDKWVQQAILDYEETKLPEKFPAYKALITEYHDGILLYEVMSDNVWNKAMRDTSGLRAYHENHKNDYQWGERIDADIFECISRELADSTAKLLTIDTLTSTTIVRMINESSALNLKPRFGKFEISRMPYLNESGVTFTEGMNPIYEYNGKFYLVNVRNILNPELKQFDEAKGAVTSDYQNYLEARWLAKIANKHEIKINSEVLYSLGE